MRTRLLPPTETLLRLRDEEGLSQAEIAEHVNEQNRARMGQDFRPVTRSAISVALLRAGQTGHLRPRYSGAIPWSPIRSEHKNQYPHSMLRLWARRELGEALTDRQSTNLRNFEAKLRSRDQVITYDPGNGGFAAVPARPGIDTGLIRLIDAQRAPADG